MPSSSITITPNYFVSSKNLTFPVYIKNSDEDYFDVTHIQEITLDTFCMFHSSLDKIEIIKRIKKYLTVV